MDLDPANTTSEQVRTEPAIGSVQGEIRTIGSIDYTANVSWQDVGLEWEERERERQGAWVRKWSVET